MKTRRRYAHHEGRLVAWSWYQKHVLRSVPLKPRARCSFVREKLAVYALFFMPAIDGVGEPAETRLLDLRDRRDIEMITFLSENYATLGNGLTTFFPNVPKNQLPASTTGAKCE